MFTNTFDSVRNQPFDIANAEGYAHLLLLRGQKPVLSLNQAVDSPIIVNNMMNEKTCDAFFKLFKEGLIGVSVTGEIHSVSEYFNASLDRCINGGTGAFIFSSLPFLYKYSQEIGAEKEIFTSMKEAYNSDVSFIQKATVLTTEERNLLECYLTAIKRLDLSMQGKLCQGKKFIPVKHKLSGLFARRVKLLNRVGVQSGISESAISLANDLLKSVNTGKRSTYYMALGLPQKAEIDLNPDELFCKKLVDVCYNESLAYGQNDNKHTTIIPNISSDSQMLVNLFNQCKDVVDSYENLLVCTAADENEVICPDLCGQNHEILTWERTAEIVAEVESIRDSKRKLSWDEALHKYSTKQQIKPFLMSGRILAISSLSFALSSFICAQLPALVATLPAAVIGTGLFNLGTSAVGSFIHDFVADNATDAVKDLLKVPSVKDVIEQRKESKSIAQITKFALKQSEFIHK